MAGNKRKQPTASDSNQRGIASFFGGVSAKPAAPQPAPTPTRTLPVRAAPPAPSAAGAAPASATPVPCAPRAVQLVPSNGPPPDLNLPLAHYAPHLAGWQRGTPLPYAHIAAALDAVSATRSRLIKELVLTNAMRAAFVLGAEPADLEALCYLLSPAKDAQSGGHRLRPDWSDDARPLGITHGTLTAAILEATGASRAHLSVSYAQLRDSGDAALAVRDGSSGGRQQLLVKPAPLSAAGVHRTLLQLSVMSGTGVEKAKGAKLAGMLRAARGTEIKWLVRTCVPHMACGISLEASVLPALAAGALVHAYTQHGADGGSNCGPSGSDERGAAKPLSATSSIPSAGHIQRAQDAVRSGYALRPDVGVLVEAALGARDDPAPPADALALMSSTIEAVCTLRPGVPSQPMLAKPCSSIADAIKLLRGGASAAVAIAAEHKCVRSPPILSPFMASLPPAGHSRPLHKHPCRAASFPAAGTTASARSCIAAPTAQSRSSLASLTT